MKSMILFVSVTLTLGLYWSQSASRRQPADWKYGTLEAWDSYYCALIASHVHEYRDDLITLIETKYTSEKNREDSLTLGFRKVLESFNLGESACVTALLYHYWVPNLPVSKQGIIDTIGLFLNKSYSSSCVNEHEIDYFHRKGYNTDTQLEIRPLFFKVYPEGDTMTNKLNAYMLKDKYGTLAERKTFSVRFDFSKNVGYWQHGEFTCYLKGIKSSKIWITFRYSALLFNNQNPPTRM